MKRAYQKLTKQTRTKTRGNTNGTKKVATRRKRH